MGKICPAILILVPYPLLLAKAAVRSKMVVLLLFIKCLSLLTLFVGLSVRSLFFFAVLCVLSSFAIISLEKREQASRL